MQDEQAFHDASAAAAPLNIYGAVCREDKEYLKRKHTFRYLKETCLFVRRKIRNYAGKGLGIPFFVS